IDEARHRRGAGDGGGGLVLGILETEELLLIVKRHLDSPSAGIPGEDEGVVDGEVGAEERFVAAPAARVSDDHDADRVVAQGAVPESGTAEDERGDRSAVEGERQRVPAATGGRHRLRGGQAVTTLARPAALTGTATPRPGPEGSIRAQAAEHVD